MQELEEACCGEVLSLGADGRTHAMLERLVACGCTVVVGEDVCHGTDAVAELHALIRGARAVLLPTPAFSEDLCVFGMSYALPMQELFSHMLPGTLLLGGRLTAQTREAAARAGIQMIDYMTMEEVQLRNAIPSAEGAISLAMQEMDRTIDGMSVLIVGYGRIGRVLAERLHVWGAQVCVAARKEIDLVRIACDGYRALKLVEGGSWKITGAYDVIFNTVPARVIGEEALRRLPAATLLIELASAPGGWSPAEAADCHTRVRYAPGLPAKYAPRTAGYLIADAIAPYLWPKEVGGR